MNRRSFVRSGSAAACLWSLPVQALLGSVPAASRRGLDIGADFSLAKLDAALKEYEYPPAGRVDPRNGEWHYRAVSALSGLGVGRLDLVRTEEGETIKYRFGAHREIPGKFVYRVEGGVEASSGDFPAVRRWESRSMISRGESGEATLNTGRTLQGEVRARQATIAEGGKTRVLPIPGGDLSWKWGIIDVVRTMAAKGIRTRAFSTLDEMDIIYARQEVRFRKNQTLRVGDGATSQVNFQIFDLQGDGVIPTVYWVDEGGRVVFVVTGAEAYLLLPGA